MIEIHDRPVQMVWCRRWSDQVLTNLAKRPRPNYTGYEAPDRYYNGYRGECALWNWFEYERSDYEYHVETSGTSEQPEFRVKNWAGQWVTIDVKTRSNPRAEEFLTPVGKPLDADFYVAVRGTPDLNRLQIWGWCTKAQVEAMPQVERYGAMHYYRKYEEFLGISFFDAAVSYVDRDRVFLPDP